MGGAARPNRTANRIRRPLGAGISPGIAVHFHGRAGRPRRTLPRFLFQRVNGQYWYGRVSEAEKVVGEEIAEIGASAKEELKRCFVFTSRNISRRKLEEMLDEFWAAHPDYEPIEHREYEDLLKREKAAQLPCAENGEEGTCKDA